MNSLSEERAMELQKATDQLMEYNQRVFRSVPNIKVVEIMTVMVTATLDTLELISKKSEKISFPELVDYFADTLKELCK